MSNEKINEEQAEQATSQATEDMNTGTVVTELDTLTAHLAELRGVLKEMKAERDRIFNYWTAEEKKVKLLLAFIKSGISARERMTAGDLMEKLIDRLV